MKLFDLHTDTLFEADRRNISSDDETLQSPAKSNSIFEKSVQTFAAFIPDSEPNPELLYKRIHKRFLEIKSADKIFSVENARLIGKDSDKVYKLKADGVRFMTLTWNDKNQLASGADAKGGLSNLGKAVILNMNKSKIALDLSHINDDGFFEAAELADNCLASHSNCRSICNHRRNLTDDQLKIIRDKNGIVGINFYPLFLGENVFESIYKNIHHMLNLDMARNIAIGSDFDGADMSPLLNKREKIVNLYNFLINKCIDKKLLDDIFYENAKKYLLKL